jgi:hypothetical protein
MHVFDGTGIEWEACSAAAHINPTLYAQQGFLFSTAYAHAFVADVSTALGSR